MAEKKLALLIANAEYQHRELRKLYAPHHDVQALEALLARAEVGGYRTQVVVDGTKNKVERAIDQMLSDGDRDDTALIFFAGHGIKDDDGELYFAIPDTEPGYLASTAVSAPWLKSRMQKSRVGRQIVLLDCCFGGAFARGTILRGDKVESGRALEIKNLGGGRGQVVITAADAMQFAIEGGALKKGAHPTSYFTRVLVEGLKTGAADIDDDGKITVDELMKYLESGLKEAGSHQRPTKWIFGAAGGDVLFAYNPLAKGLAKTQIQILDLARKYELIRKSLVSDRKADFFAREMYMVHVTNFPHDRKLRLQEPLKSAGNARLEVWSTDPKDMRAIPPSSNEGFLFVASTFSVMNSGNQKLYAPKPSWKFKIKAADDDGDLAGMNRLNLKAMYNDPSQMREALAWNLFKRVGVPAPRHTFAKLAFDEDYRGLFSLIEEVDIRFLEDHFGKNHLGNLYKAYCGDKGCATLEHLSKDGDDSGRQYFTLGESALTYGLKTNRDDPTENTYDDLAVLIRTINGVKLPGGKEKFGTDAFRKSVDRILNASAFLRWAAANVLLGGWDNYFATPANYYLYNSGREGAENDFMDSPFFTFIPWAYGNCLGIDYFDTRWQDTDLLDWPGNTTRYSSSHKRSSIPLVQNLFSNDRYRHYYLDSVEYLLDTEFNPDAIAAQISPDSETGLWAHVRQAAYLESKTSKGAPFTGRQFTNNEVYRAGCKQKEIRRGKFKIEGILNYVQMRYDSARRQLKELRKAIPRGARTDEFSTAMEPLPGRLR